MPVASRNLVHFESIEVGAVPILSVAPTKSQGGGWRAGDDFEDEMMRLWPLGNTCAGHSGQCAADLGGTHNSRSLAS